MFTDPVLNTNAYIRIRVHSRRGDDVYYQIRLVNEMPQSVSGTIVVRYGIPKGSKSLGEIVKRRLAASPCMSFDVLARKVPINRTVLTPKSELRSVLDRVFELKLRPRPFSDNIRLDFDEYVLEFIGDNRIRFVSDDDQSDVVKWMMAVENAIESNY